MRVMINLVNLLQKIKAAKEANQKMEDFFGKLMVCLRTYFVNPNSPLTCKHDETCKLIRLSSEKISNPDLKDTLFFV